MFNNSIKLCKLQKVEQNFMASEQVDKIYLLTCLSPVQTTEHKTLILVHKLKEHRKLSPHLNWTLRLIVSRNKNSEISEYIYIDYLKEE